MSPADPKAPQSHPPPHERGLQQQFDLLIASVVDYAFILFDLSNKVTGWNIGAERILGYTEPEILGRSGALFFTPADREKGAPEQEVETALRDGRAAVERWHLRKDGARFWASGVMTALRHANGEPRSFAKVMRDLTERRRAEEALRHSEQQFRLFVDNVRDHALLHVAPDARIASWNTGAQRLFGYTPQEIVGKPVSTLFLADDRARGYAEKELARAQAELTVEDERWLRRQDGTQFFARWVTYTVVDNEGQLRGYAKVLRDETDRLRAEQARSRGEQRERTRLRNQAADAGAELDRTKEQLRALAAGLMTAQEEERRRIARELHDDLNQRLALLEVGVVQIERGLPQAEQAEMERLREEVAQLSDRVRGLSHGLHPAVLEDFGLEPALRALVQEFETVHGMSVSLIGRALPRRAPLSLTTTLYRIAQEALRNVVKHAPSARVIVELSHGDDAVCLAVKDDGPGFDPKTLSVRGGLGIVSMDERARLLGGTMHLHSTPGAGTEIAVTVPWPDDDLLTSDQEYRGRHHRDQEE